MGKRYIGTTEDRINKWMRMCLQWQFDIRRGIEKKASHYFTKYHVGKYPKSFFNDLAYKVVDRSYVINKMNQISESRMLRDRSLGMNSNRVLLLESDVISGGRKGVKVNDNTIVKNVAKTNFNLCDVTTDDLMRELEKRTVGMA